jgi:hypothetical protein
VLDNDWLMDEMVSLTQEDQVIWKKNAVQAYFAKLDQFLEQMLLLYILYLANLHAVLSCCPRKTAIQRKCTTGVYSLKNA